MLDPSRQDASCRADGTGEFAVAGVEPGTYRLVAAAPQFARLEQTVEISEESVKQPHEIVLEPAATLRFFVRDGDGGMLMDPRIRAEWVGDATREPFLPARQDADGATIVTGMGTGKYRYVVEHRDSFPAEGTIELVAGTSRDLEVVLRTRVAVYLELYDALGAPMKGRAIELVDLLTNASAEDWMSRGWLPAGELETDDAGCCFVSGLPKGRYRLRAGAIDQEVELIRSMSPDDEPLIVRAPR